MTKNHIQQKLNKNKQVLSTKQSLQNVIKEETKYKQRYKISVNDI